MTAPAVPVDVDDDPPKARRVRVPGEAIGPLIAGVFVLARVYAVAGGDTGIATALLSGIGVVPTVLASALVTLPVLSLALLTWGVLRCLERRFVHRTPRRGGDVLLVAAGAAAVAAFVPLGKSGFNLAAVFAGFALAAIVSRSGWPTGQSANAHPAGLSIYAWLGAVTCLVLAVIALTSKAVWTTAESIRVRDGDDEYSMTGYRLQDDEERVLVLVDVPRILVSIDADMILETRPCDPLLRPPQAPALFQRLLDNDIGTVPELPTCPYGARPL